MDVLRAGLGLVESPRWHARCAARRRRCPATPDQVSPSRSGYPSSKRWPAERRRSRRHSDPCPNCCGTESPATWLIDRGQRCRRGRSARSDRPIHLPVRSHLKIRRRPNDRPILRTVSANPRRQHHAPPGSVQSVGSAGLFVSSVSSGSGSRLNSFTTHGPRWFAVVMSSGRPTRRRA